MNSKEMRKKEENTSSLLIKRILIGAAITAGLFFVILCAVSLAALKSDMSEGLYATAGRAIAFVSGFAGGFVSVLPVRKKGLVTGAAGGALGAVPAMIAVFLANTKSSPVSVLILLLIFAAAAAVGGITAANIRKKQKFK